MSESLDIKAEELGRRAHDLLDLDYSGIVYHEYRGVLGPRWSLGVRENFDESNGFRDSELTRYIYINNHDEPQNETSGASNICTHRPYLSLSVESLKGEYAQPRGLLENWYELPEIIAQSDTASEAEIHLIELAKDLLVEFHNDRPLNLQKLDELDFTFQALLNAGSRSINRQKRYRLADEQSTIRLVDYQIRGSLEQVPMSYANSSRLRVEQHETTNALHAVLQEYLPGRFETFEEIADTLEREAAVPGAEVVRDGDGDIIYVGSNVRNREVIEESERAMGLRKLTTGFLSLFDDSITEIEKRLLAF